MTNQREISKMRFKVGVFTVLGLAFIGALTVFVNDKPFWWRPCQFVQINIDDATGLKTKSPVRSLGLQVGYLKSVRLFETYVELGICITAPVDVLSSTRAFIRSEGFLGDKFVELKPVHFKNNIETIEEIKVAKKKEARPKKQMIEKKEVAIVKKSADESNSPVVEAPAGGADGAKDEDSVSKQKTSNEKEEHSTDNTGKDDQTFRLKEKKSKSYEIILGSLFSLFGKNAYAEEEDVITPSKVTEDAALDATQNAAETEHVEGLGDSENKPRKIPVGEKSGDMQKIIKQVNVLTEDLTDLTRNLKQALNPTDLKNTMNRINQVLDNAAKTLSPQGNLTLTAQRTLSKLEKSIELLHDQIKRITEGKGSLGKILNDEVYADELERALKNVNKLLNKADQMRLNMDVGAEQLTAYNGGRGWIRLGIWPRRDRYYLVGVSIDPRGLISITETKTTVNGASTTVNTTQVEQSGMLLTAMVGKVYFTRFDVSIGAIHGDGALSLKYYAWFEEGEENRLQWTNQVYSRLNEGSSSISFRSSIEFFAWPNLYIKGGIESIKKVNGSYPFYFGAGVSFDDDDIKLLFTFL